MTSYDFSLIRPRQGNCLNFDGPVVYTRDFPDSKTPYTEGCSICRLGDRTGKKFTQTIYKNDKRTIKNNQITQAGKPIYENVLHSSKDYFSSTRLVDGAVVGGYVATKTPKQPLKGFKGILENIAWHIGNKANGCERKGFNKIAGIIINKLRTGV